MREKYKSLTLKKGSGKTHDDGVNNVIAFIVEHFKNVDIQTEKEFKFSPKFCKDNKLRSDYSHKCDIFLSIWSIDEDTNKKIDYIFIEVDGEKHSTKNQKINDGLFEKHVMGGYNKKVIRLDKRECLGQKEDRDIYLMQIFANHKLI